MKPALDFGVSPLTKRIFCGRSRPVKDGIGREWVGKKTDVTDAAIRAVFEWMFTQAAATGYYEISIKGFGVMRFEREKNETSA